MGAKVSCYTLHGLPGEAVDIVEYLLLVCDGCGPEGYSVFQIGYSLTFTTSSCYRLVITAQIPGNVAALLMSKCQNFASKDQTIDGISARLGRLTSH